jgi:acetyl-CoA synthetase
MIGLKEQTVVGAASYAEACSRHRWHIPQNYNVAADCLDRHRSDPRRVALYYEDDQGPKGTYTFGQIIEASNRAANALRGIGVRRGDVVALNLPQRPETAILHMALYRIGAVALPISRLFGPDGIRYRVEHGSACAIAIEASQVDKLEELRKLGSDAPKIIVVGGDKGGVGFDELLRNGSPDFAMEPGSAEDPILLMYTSGTTGDAKGVLHAARFVAGHNGADYSANFFRSTDVFYSPSDWAWVGGLMLSLLALWPYGVPMVVWRSDQRFDPERALDLMERYGVTMSFLAPTALKALREVTQPRKKHQHLKLRCVSCGAESVSPELARWTLDELGCDFNQLYGQTEAMIFIGNCSVLEKPDPAALGKPFPGHRVAILDPDGVPLPVGETGEIAIGRESPIVMKEYWKSPEAMKEKFVGEWCRTGDLGCVDDRGEIHFQGRTDDIIKTSGLRVGPAEVEAKIMEHEAVASCAIVGVPDRERGEAIKAFVKLMPGFEPSARIAGEIQQHVKTRLAAHAYPREVEFVESLPMTVTGKVRRRELRELERQRRSGA